MRFAKVVGTTVATVKDPELVGLKLLLCVSCGADGAERGAEPFVAVDTAGAGTGDVVLVAEGSAARVAAGSHAAPTDAAIVGIVDSIEIGGGTTYGRGSARRRDAHTSV